MTNVCRTCLQKSKKTFGTNQTITDFGCGEVKISIVLRFCMPELYLGLSSNPEICHDCKESLIVAYKFKKKCLRTENIIGNYLKNARCTAKSVNLHDVLGYFDDQAHLQLETEKVKKANMTLNAQDIISEWDEVPDEVVNSEQIEEKIVEVRQSAPNPAKTQGNTNMMKFCHETGLFLDQQGSYYDCSGYLVDINQIRRDAAKIINSEVTNREETTIAEGQITKDNPGFVQDADNFCKITSVFSLSTEISDKDSVGDANSVNDASTFKNINSSNINLVDIKEEPLEVEINGERVDFNYYPTDEETLDASETASYEDMQSTSRLQGIIDNLPEISDTNQYVDVPEFVHINNFGLKELEELRRQQQIDGKQGTKKIILNFKNKFPALSSSEPSDSSEKETASNASQQENKTEAFTKVPLSTLPETLVINGKTMVKCSEGYRLMEDPGAKPFQVLSRVKPSSVLMRTNNTTQDSKAKPGERRRKKIKIVPINDRFKLCSQKGAKLDLKVGKAPKSKRILSSAEENKDVVVLFTNYNYDGDYINDHDYLVNPYKRNRILIEEGTRWFCMCYICYSKHHVYNHVAHMQGHGSLCKICRVDLGTPYMLNVHVKSHTQPCPYCIERVPYGLKESHEKAHIKSELEFENRKKKRGSPQTWRGRARRTYGDDAVGTVAERVPSPIKKTEMEPVNEEIKQEKWDDILEEDTTEESSEDEEWKKTGSGSKKPKKRRRNFTKNDADSMVVERSSRVLRSNVRKSYSETECEDVITSNLK